MDFESFQDGVLLYIGVEEGKAVPVDAVIAVMGKEGEDYKAALAAEGGSAPLLRKKLRQLLIKLRPLRLKLNLQPLLLTYQKYLR